ncbi:MAG: helix-turn-helix transcriptional regulator [Lachnospiraceae bacterium]|nr:helix-turn-helix transcriptional regulator [Lachnospiraceae bacterium]MBD5455130.1 helix-turn-helix transcriptional regulator [Lachnospiraceae bacterium]
MYPTIDMKATGVRIRQIMNQRKLTVKDVKKYLNLSSVQSIYHWFNGQSVPTVDNLYALSELFQLPVDAMIAGNRKYRILFSDESFYIRMNVYCMMARKLNVV